MAQDSFGALGGASAALEGLINSWPVNRRGPSAQGNTHRAEEVNTADQEVAAKAEMLIRKPVAEVFQAFVDPEITSKFWFSRGSGRLETGKSVRWDWEMYDFSVDAMVKALEPNKRLLVEWSAYGAPTDIEWLFTSRPDGTTFVSVTNSGFGGSLREKADLAIGATEGFAFVLAGAKALLEHGVQLNLVPDRFPDGLPKT